MIKRAEHATDRICSVNDIGNHGKEAVVDSAEGRLQLMLFKHQGQISAWINRCPHEKKSLNVAPDRFLISNSGQLVCAHHGATFELAHGKCVDGPCTGSGLTEVPVSVVDDWVMLRKSD